ncbi:MAG: AarF/UbiB family protein, partial [Deltaproteobacteria bacterium]
MVSIVSTVRDIQRLREILTVLVRHGFGEVVQRTGLGRIAGRQTEADSTEDIAEVEALVSAEAPPLKRIGFGERLKLVLQDLGPSFVKLGQIMSTRPDVIPEDVVRELKQLQDRVTPLEFEDLEAQILAELDRPIDEVFEELDRAPLASASIAQVHRAKLRTEDGPIDVVLKIQRPGIKN